MTAEALYHEAIVRLARAAHGAGRLPDPHGAATVDNPLCGDRVTVELRVEGGRIAALAQRVRGCLLCEAAASLVGRAAVGRTGGELAEGRRRLGAILGGGAGAPEAPWEDLGLFAPVAGVPSRHRCVLLPFEALGEALAQAGG